MKLATYHDGSRDGQLVVVSRDLASAHFANGIASRLQQVLDDWNFIAPQLEALSQQLNQGRLRHAFDFDARRCLAPLPRAFHWRDWPQGGDGRNGVGDRALPAQGSLPSGPLAWPQAGLAAITGDVALGVDERDAIEAVRLLMLVAQGRPEAAGDSPVVCCAPVAITPDELGPAWRGGRLQPGADAESPLQLQVRVDGRRAAAREQALPKRWPQDRHVGELIAEAAASGRLGAGAVMAWSPALDAALPAQGTAQRWRAELLDATGTSLFGAIELSAAVEPAAAPASTAD